MTPAAVLTSAAILGGVGLTFGTLIALAHRKLRVWEDPRISGVEDLLPGANCGACGYAGCRAFAEATVGGEVAPARCTVMSEGEVETVAAYLGVEAGEAEKVVARLLCAGGSDIAVRKAEYRGIESCAAAVATTGGGKACPWGCVGLADCAVACDFDAIVMSETELPVVLLDLCTACGDCVDACPLDLFTLMPTEHRLLVQCRCLFEGDAATAVCRAACDACGRCAMDAPPGLIEMVAGLPEIDYGKNEAADPTPTFRCPTGAIVWVEGRQFDPGSVVTGLAARDRYGPREAESAMAAV